MKRPNLYDELPYKSLPIEWTAPERLALTSLLHGGPRAPIGRYRVLELGCANGANLLPLAYYRQHGSFVGVDGAYSQIEIANRQKLSLNIRNIEFIHADFLCLEEIINDQFDYIITHGVFSWIDKKTRDNLLKFCAKNLSPSGLLYINYNSMPGWKIRGMVRDFLLAQTSWARDLQTRSKAAQDVASRVALALQTQEHPYTQLMAKEFQFICDNHVSYVAHEYLCDDNYAYWRSDFLSLIRNQNLEYVADADFSYSSGRVPEGLLCDLEKEQILGSALEDTADLFCYRQLHSPILTREPLLRRNPTVDEFADLFIASCLTPCRSTCDENQMFKHPSGYKVEAKHEAMRELLAKLQPHWPRSLNVKAAVADVSEVMDDLMLLHRNGLIELRCVEPGDFRPCREPLNGIEVERGYITTPYHTLETASGSFAGVPTRSFRNLAPAE